MRKIILEKVDSTNTYLKNLALKSEPEGTVVIAREQTNGRGRTGKSFFSPADTGLYMSVLLRPPLSPEDSLLITSAAAVATARAIENLCNKKCMIKWVNDIYIDRKKVAGILCEGDFDFKNKKTNYVVLGIGVNVTTTQFPNELKNIASGISDVDIRERLADKIIKCFFEIYPNILKKDFITEYRERSYLTGKNVEVYGAESLCGTVIDIDDCCRMVLKTLSGDIITISSGEVSTRLS